LHLINARVTYLEGVFHVQVRILWFILFDNLKPKKPKEPKEPKEKKVKEVRKKAATDKKRSAKKTTADQRNQKPSVSDKMETDTLVKNTKQPGGISYQHQIPQAAEQISKAVLAVKNESVNSAEVVIEDNNIDNSNQENIMKENSFKENNKENNNEENSHKENNEIKINYENSKEESNKKHSKSRLELLLEKIRNKILDILERLKSLKGRLHDFWEGIKSKLQSILTSAAGIRQKISLILDFIRDEYNKQGFQITFSSVKRLLKHILPTKLKSRIVFGTGDPCSTGQALGAMSILYSFYGDKIQIVPDFQNKRLEGTHCAQGRIRLVTILIIVIKLMLDKRFQQLRKNFQILKEAL
jgi:hypothetical protein